MLGGGGEGVSDGRAAVFAALREACEVHSGLRVMQVITFALRGEGAWGLSDGEVAARLRELAAVPEFCSNRPGLTEGEQGYARGVVKRPFDWEAL